jgi:hypothetical protein
MKWKCCSYKTNTEFVGYGTAHLVCLRPNHNKLYFLLFRQIIGVVFIMLMQVIASPLSAEDMNYQVCTGNQTLGDTSIIPFDYTSKSF